MATLVLRALAQAQEPVQSHDPVQEREQVHAFVWAQGTANAQPW